MKPMFAACMKFDPSHGKSWAEYIQWSGYDHLREVVTTDTMLCPNLIEELREEDWNFNIQEDYRIEFFRDYEYLARRVSYDRRHHNLLELTEQPTSLPKASDGFTFSGYDILDSYDSISVLLNCGAFPDIFTRADINTLGLVSDLNCALDIADRIRSEKPDDDHCRDCRVWRIARYTKT